MITARNRDRSNFGSWGLKGGHSGANSTFVRNPGGNDQEILGNRDIVHCQPEDVIRIAGGGAGGWGDPLDRDLAHVAADVAAGLVSRANAAKLYGVVFEGATIDAAASAVRRGELRRPRPLFDYGPGRSAFEAVWNAERYAALTELLAATAIAWRHWVKHAIFAAVDQGSHDHASPADQVRRIYTDLAARFPQLGGLAQAAE
jgi:N-methylhydantoinase B